MSPPSARACYILGMKGQGQPCVQNLQWTEGRSETGARLIERDRVQRVKEPEATMTLGVLIQDPCPRRVSASCGALV